jgi:hypothetical protein
MYPAGFEPAIPARNRSAAGVDTSYVFDDFIKRHVMDRNKYLFFLFLPQA